MTPRLSHFLSKINNLTINCRSTLGNARCQNIRAIDIVTSDMKLLLFVIYISLSSCYLDMQLPVTIQTTYNGTIK